MRHRWVVVSACLGFVGCGAPGGERGEVVVFAAASLSLAVDEIARDHEQEHGVRVKTSYAASSTLAKQIEMGAPAHVYVAADPRWMAWLEERGRVKADRSADLLGNSLVIVAPSGKRFSFDPEGGESLAEAFAGRLAVGDPDYVPVGRYAREALERSGGWSELESRLAPASDARAALAFVERGECAAGIVYASDAATSGRVETVAAIPESWHTRIVYPVAIVEDAGPAAEGFVATLRDADDVFRRYGFRVLEAAP